jgi:uncharacterized membrane protein
VLFEVGGLIMVVPLYGSLFGRSAQSSLVLMSAISIAVLIWSPLHNALFDRVDYVISGRQGSARPHHLRLIHALSHELTPIVVTLPLLIGLGGHGLGDALAVNGGLTVLYIVYTYGFYLTYDRLCPVQLVLCTADAGDALGLLTMRRPA